MSFRSKIAVLLAVAACYAPLPAAADQAAAAAEAEVAAAQQAVDEAIRLRSLWTTARDAIQEARSALQKGDFRAAIQAARFAKEQAELGIAQTRYPRFPSKG